MSEHGTTRDRPLGLLSMTVKANFVGKQASEPVLGLITWVGPGIISQAICDRWAQPG
jgi:hypothetical protein